MVFNFFRNLFGGEQQQPPEPPQNIITSIEQLDTYIFNAEGKFLVKPLTQGRLTVNPEDTRFIDRITTDILTKYAQNTELTTVYKNATFFRNPLFTTPEFVELKKNEHIAFRTVIVGNDGQLYVISGRFAEQENFSQAKFNKKLSHRLGEIRGNFDGISEYADLAIKKTVWFIETVTR